MHDRFHALFLGNPRSYGQAVPPKAPKERLATMTKKQVSEAWSLFTVDEQVDASHWIKHLSGEVGVGIVPIMDDSNCWWAALDIDCHGEDESDIDLVELNRKITERQLPLIVCRTKSGGAHAYVFGSEPLKAGLLRSTLKRWSDWLGYPGCEIFPKQANLRANADGAKPRGNWLNMPYFDVDDTDRYAIESGRKISPEYFLELAEASKISNADLVQLNRGEHSEAPPCIQRMIVEGVNAGHRNNALYNLTVYLRRAFPESYRDKAMDMNAKVFESPLPHDEAKRTVTSAGRRDYKYKCQEAPCRALCDSKACVKREFGITEDENQILNLGELPEFTNLDKHLTNPVKWVLYVDNQPLPAMLVRDLHSYKSVREATSEILNRVPPGMKNDQWSVVLDKLMQNCRVIEAPEDASTAGVVVAKLYEFLDRTDLEVDPDDTSLRQRMVMGQPVLQTVKGRSAYCFLGPSFVDFLRKSRSEELKGSNLWMALRGCGLDHAKLKVGGKTANVWYLPYDPSGGKSKLETKEYESEF